jgi:hypothetical protein
MLLSTVVILGRLYYYIKRLSNEMTTYEEWKLEKKQKPYLRGVKGQSDDEKKSEGVHMADKLTKSAKKRENDKKAAWAASYGYHTSPEKRRSVSRELTERLKRIRAKPTSDAEDLDLPSPRPARKKGDPNIAFKNKRMKRYHDKITEGKGTRPEEKRPMDYDAFDFFTDEEEDSWDEHMTDYD